MTNSDTILDILGKLNSGEFENLSQKDILIATFYEQAKIRETIKQLNDRVNNIQDPQLVNIKYNQDILSKRIDDLEGFADEYEGKQKLLNNFGIFFGIIGSLATLGTLLYMFLSH